MVFLILKASSEAYECYSPEGSGNSLYLCKEDMHCQDLNYGHREKKQLHYQRTQNSINISRVGKARDLYKLSHTSSLRLLNIPMFREMKS
jgi:hypothetical protein